MEEVTWKKFSGMRQRDIAVARCLKVVDGEGKMLMYAVVRPEQAMMHQIEALCSLINAGRDRSLLGAKETYPILSTEPVARGLNDTTMPGQEGDNPEWGTEVNSEEGDAHASQSREEIRVEAV